MTASPYASDAKIAEACAAIGAALIGQTEQILLQQLVVAAATGGGSAPSATTWGGITGTLGDQTDLQTALNAKFDDTGGTLTGAIVINGGTVTDSTPLLSLTQTWNDAADTFHLDTANVINTASQAASTLLRRQVGGVTRFSVGVDGKITLLAQSYPVASISSTANANYGFGFSAGMPNVIANNQEAAAGVFMGIAGTGRPSWGVPSLNITGYSSAPSGSGYGTGAFLASLAAHQLTLGYTQAITPNDQEVKAHDVTNGTGAKLTISGGNAVTTGTGGAVHIKGGTGATAEGTVILGTATGAIGFFGNGGTTIATGNATAGISGAGTGGTVLNDTSFDGGAGGGAYTIGGLVATLKSYGLIS